MKHIFIFIFSIVLISCGKTEKQNEFEKNQPAEENFISITKSQFEAEQMQLGTISEQIFNETIKTNGFIDVPPQNRASVTMFISGFVKNTPLLVGDKVRKGQRLITLQSTEFVELQQRYAEVTEQLNYLKSEFERQQILYTEKITSQKNFLKAESTYKSTLAQHRGLRKKLEMMNVNPASVKNGNITSVINLYAPIQGSITKVKVSNGAFVSPADEIMEIVNTDHIHLELSVYEKDILKIKKNQAINFKIPEASNHIYKAEVHLVGTSVDEMNRTIKVHGHIEEDEHTNFVTGMFVEAEIITKATKKFALPKEAVAEIGGDYFVLKLENKKDEVYTFNKVKLDVGKQSEDFVEVLNINDLMDEKVLVKGVFMLIIE